MLSRGRPVPKIPEAVHEILSRGRLGQLLTQRGGFKFCPGAGLCRRFPRRSKFNTTRGQEILSRGRLGQRLTQRGGFKFCPGYLNATRKAEGPWGV